MQEFNEPWYALWLNECLHSHWNLYNHLKDYDHFFNDGMNTIKVWKPFVCIYSLNSFLLTNTVPIKSLWLRSVAKAFWSRGWIWINGSSRIEKSQAIRIHSSLTPWDFPVFVYVWKQSIIISERNIWKYLTRNSLNILKANVLYCWRVILMGKCNTITGAYTTYHPNEIFLCLFMCESSQLLSLKETYENT